MSAGWVRLFVRRKGVPDRVPAVRESKPPRSLPVHVAIIMDGNGRWAARRGLPRAAGHRAGVESLRRVVEVSIELGIQYLTVYAFSTENWRRPRSEVSALMDLLSEYIDREIDALHKQGVRVIAIGRLEELPERAVRDLTRAMERTAGNSGLTLNIALNYGGRSEIVDAVKSVVHAVRQGSLTEEQINEECLAGHMYTAGGPDPDLLIRPAGEMRISNFLLWQVAYAEFWSTTTLWPDFSREEFLRAIDDFGNRHRRFGGLENE